VVSRLVVLPDYQGIGIGYKFLCAMAEYYTKMGWNFRIVTSAKNLIHKLYKSSKWVMERIGINKRSSNVALCFNATIRTKCKTASFEFRG
jgi:GNAT superfamily N-acetyltransferase